MKSIFRMTRYVWVVVAWAAIASSCSDDEEEMKELKLSYEDITVGIFEGGKSIRIASGNGEYDLKVANEKMVKASLHESTQMTAEGLVKTMEIYIQPQGIVGMTMVEVTDKISGQTIPVRVFVGHYFISFKVESSNHPRISSGDKRHRFVLEDIEVSTFKVEDFEKEVLTGSYTLSDEGILTLRYKDEENRDIIETYDTQESDYFVAPSVRKQLGWNVDWTYGKDEKPVTKRVYLRLKGIDNDYEMACTAHKIVAG